MCAVRSRARPGPAWASRALRGEGVWVPVAAALALAGGRFGRRAAARGLLALAGASAATRLAARDGGRRPDDVGIWTRLSALVTQPWRPPPPSPPSGAAAAAAAFATGATLELPVAGLPLAALAAAVGWSPGGPGGRRPRDVVAGAALGVGTALATRRIWPVAPRTSAVAGPVVARPGGTTPGPGGAGLVVVVNQSSGPSLGAGADEVLRDALPAAELVEVGDPADLVARLEEAAGRAQVLGVCGGDGTVNAAAQVADQAGLPLLVVPGGTLNHFAQAVGTDTMDRAIAAARDGGTTAVDLARVDGRPFLNVASFGVYVELVRARERLEDRIGKWPAVVVALVGVLRRATPLDVEIDGQRRRLWLCFVGNCCYHPPGFAPSWRERLDDGMLDVRLVDAAPGWARLRLVAAVVTGRLARSRVYEARTATRLEVRSLAGPLDVAVDGEVFPASESFVIDKHDRGLQVVVPVSPPE